MTINGVQCEFHHMGIPTRQERPGERFSEPFGMHTSDSECRSVHIQWHRFEENSSLHPLIQTVPHVAFKVDDLDRAIAGQTVLLGPFEPIPNFRVAMIEDGGQPVELIQTALTDEEIWHRAKRDGISYNTTTLNLRRAKRMQIRRCGFDCTTRLPNKLS